MRLNGEGYTVIGVMSSNYRIGVYSGSELWAPLVFPLKAFSRHSPREPQPGSHGSAEFRGKC